MAALSPHISSKHQYDRGGREGIGGMLDEVTIGADCAGEAAPYPRRAAAVGADEREGDFD